MCEAKAALTALVDRFRAEEKRLCANSSRYSETEVRTEFIDPIFACLGWDMNNAAGIANSMKDVVREESQPTETTAKRPDYTFRIAAIRKFFVEAKKPAVDIRTHKESAFQVRSYGWTAGLPISVLTNFRTLRVYDTRTAPATTDDANVGLLLDLAYTDFAAHFNSLVAIFGRAAVGGGSIEAKYGTGAGAGLPINTVFLARFQDWRLQIAQDLHTRYPAVDIGDINDIAQKVINRFVFIRMCEDRGIEGEERLKKVVAQKSVVELRKLFADLDKRYNTGLFDTAHDLLQSTYAIDAQVLVNMVDELYFPKAPYSFGVLDADFLGQVYELFLTKRLIINPTGQVNLVDKPAYVDREVVTTPQPLVDELVRRTIQGRVATMRAAGTLTLANLLTGQVLDLAVGSGRFLLRCLDELVDVAIQIGVATNETTHIYERAPNDYRLAFSEKRKLLQHCLFGIDIDFNAVEVARFSLLIKLLEDETKATLPTGKKILPNLDDNIVWGNSVVADDFAPTDPAIRAVVKPMAWAAVGLQNAYGAIVGNPPYVKTEDIKRISPEELAYYKKTYQTSYKQFDKYFVFIEQASKKLAAGGWLGLVVPNKWMTIESGKKLRALLTANQSVAEIVDFGNELLFEGKSTYVCLLVLANAPKTTFFYRRVDDYATWLQDPSSKGVPLAYTLVNRQPGAAWVLPATPAEANVLSILTTNSYRLADVADVVNGIQTSAEDVFPISAWTEVGNEVHFSRDGRNWQVEKSITKPYLMDSTVHVKSYQAITADALVIYPYTQGQNGEAVLIPPATLHTQYPLAWAYLSHYKTRLTRRDVSPAPGPGEFYRYGRHQALVSAFNAPKIIYSVNQLGDKYGYDQTGVGFASGGTAGEVAIINARAGYTLEFLLALCHQRAIEYFLRKRGSPFRGGYYSRGSAVMADCPVPKLDLTDPRQQRIMATITTQVRQLITHQTSLLTASGRSHVTLQRNIQTCTQLIAAEFHKIWNFAGDDQRISLPGE
jgi:hypothetical protein